jgi:molybdopterin-containing oxidoreductase family membrane subunit
MMNSKQSYLEADAVLFQPILKTGKNFIVMTVLLLALTTFGAYAYLTQYRTGLGVTGLSRQIFWGIYIINFVFFIGLSHAGTFISAVLRITRAEWRRPITRASELITVIALFFGVCNVIIDLGRPDRILYILRYPHFRSPLLWDVCSISAYLVCSSILLYLALIPDIALLRDHAGKRQVFYRVFSLGYTGTKEQRIRLEKAISFMSILVIPVMVTVHTVVSYIFAMTIQPGWHSAIFGPYFVCGALYSGVASVIIIMVLLRKYYGLENYIRPAQFQNLGTLLCVLTFLWFYFALGEQVTTIYGNDPVQMGVFRSRLTGPFAPQFWSMVLFCFVIPLPLLVLKRSRNITGIFIASVSVLIGMWLERFVIIIPTLTRQRLMIGSHSYWPTWVEWSIMAGCFSFFMLIYLLFTKFFPIVSVWEVKEGRERSLEEVRERFKTYHPAERENTIPAAVSEFTLSFEKQFPELSSDEIVRRN